MRSVLASLVGAARHVPGRLLGVLPGPPDDAAAADPLLGDIDRQPPEEQQARRQAWLAQFRRGRGDGNG
jgi:hypothetical protein